MSFVKWPTRMAEICGDDESAPKLRRQIANSWLVKFLRLQRRLLHARDGQGLPRGRGMITIMIMIPIIIVMITIVIRMIRIIIIMIIIMIILTMTITMLIIKATGLDLSPYFLAVASQTYPEIRFSELHK